MTPRQARASLGSRNSRRIGTKLRGSIEMKDKPKNPDPRKRAPSVRSRVRAVLDKANNVRG